MKELNFSVFAIVLSVCMVFIELNAKDTQTPEPNNPLNECRIHLRGTFEVNFSDRGRSTLVFSESKVYYFREFPDLYWAECIDWVAPCTYNLTVCEINDPIIPRRKMGLKATEKITDIQGNKIYFERYENRRKVHEGFITKLNSEVPKDFQD